MNDQAAATLVATVKSMKDALDALRALEDIQSKVGNIETLLHQLVTSNEKLAASNTQLARMMEQAWTSYNKMGEQTYETTTTTKPKV